VAVLGRVAAAAEAAEVVYLAWVFAVAAAEVLGSVAIFISDKFWSLAVWFNLTGVFMLF
jgi:hypothetical protein